MTEVITTEAQIEADAPQLREAPYTRIGTQVQKGATASEALKQAGLADWNVRKISLTASELDEDGVNTFAINDRFAMVFNDPTQKGATQYLPGGVVGSNFTPVQNEAVVPLLDALRGEGGVEFASLGILNGGARTFFSMQVPTGIQIGGVDPIDLYLVGINNHVGSGAFRFVITPVRPLCSNQLNAAIKGAVSSFSVRHVSGAAQRVQEEAHRALGLTSAYAEAFELEAEKLLATPMTNRQFDAWAAKITKAGTESARASNKAQASLDTLKTLWREAPTTDKIKGTRWAAYNVYTEAIDHFLPVKRTAGKEDVTLARASRSLLTLTTSAKEEAFRSLIPA
jgi:phage/plasmid-like protein (TIGR03299 family)